MIEREDSLYLIFFLLSDLLIFKSLSVKNCEGLSNESYNFSFFELLLFVFITALLRSFLLDLLSTLIVFINSFFELSFLFFIVFSLIILLSYFCILFKVELFELIFLFSLISLPLIEIFFLLVLYL